MHSNPSHTSPDEARGIRLVCLAAQLVLENGGETYRVEETAMRMAGGLGFEDANITAFPTSIYVNVGDRCRVRRITRRGTNTSRLARINDVSRKVERGEMNADEAEQALLSIAADPGWKQITLIIAYGVSAASFSLLFGGNIGALLVALATGMLVQSVEPLFSHMSMGKLFFDFSGGFLVAALSQGLSLLLPYGSVNAAIIGGIMPMLTGLLMTTAVRDTMYGDLVSGICRAVEALLLAASVALGVFAGLKLMALMGGVLL